MAHSLITNITDNVWFIDSRCSNHMTGIRSLFRDLDESQKSEVRLGDDKQVQVDLCGPMNKSKFKGTSCSFFRRSTGCRCVPLKHLSNKSHFESNSI